MGSKKTNLDKVIKGIKTKIDKVVAQHSLRPLGREAIRLLVVRTRLGYGVDRQGGDREKLKALSPNYIAFRKRARNNLSPFTRPSRSNLTFTGQMLDSMQIIKISKRSIVIGPKGRRSDGHSNQDIAKFVQKAGRSFLNISRTEQIQLIRFYRRIFGDLAKSQRLTF